MEFTEEKRLGDGLKREYDRLYNRESVNVSGAAKLAIFTVMGQLTGASGTASAVAGASNTGDGAMGAITVGAGAKDGDYVLTITTAAANAGDFQVVDPDGAVVGTGSVGAEFTGGGLTFTLADGAIDFAVDDTFTISVVTDQSGDWVAYDAGASDGRETAAGILLQAVDATEGDVEAPVLARGPAVFARGELVGADAAAITALEDLGIVFRDEVGGDPVALSDL